ncbi:MAG: RNA polymerase sigma factor [Luteolibacter sp.]
MNTTRFTLIQRVKDPLNEDAWQSFSDAYGGYILAVLQKVSIGQDEAADLRQEILLKLWKRLPEFDYEPDKGKFRTWLYQIIKNTAFTHMSARESQQRRDELYVQENGADSDVLDQLMRDEWKAFICQKALENLRGIFVDQSVEIFEKTLEGSSVEDLAVSYGLKENTIYRIKNRVKERLIVEVRRLRHELE